LLANKSGVGVSSSERGLPPGGKPAADLKTQPTWLPVRY
jgi:hypothetical protein